MNFFIFIDKNINFTGIFDVLYFSADYSKVQQLRGFLERLICREVEAVFSGVANSDLDAGKLSRAQSFDFRLGFS